jgi:hypothetical protein
VWFRESDAVTLSSQFSTFSPEDSAMAPSSPMSNMASNFAFRTFVDLYFALFVDLDFELFVEL